MDMIDHNLHRLGHSWAEPELHDVMPLSFIRCGDTLHVGCQFPRRAGEVVQGQIDPDSDRSAIVGAAELCAVALLSEVRRAIDGDWSRVQKMGRITVFVQATGICDLSCIGDAVSRVLTQVLGKRGEHVCTVLGVSALPFGAIMGAEGDFQLSTPHGTLGLFP